MSSERPNQTLADYVALVISPVLIMGLVGSLVFFLLDVLYRGQHLDRLQWILFFFVFGAVLVARISMMADIAGRASLYGLVLAALVWIGMGVYLEYDADGKAQGLNWLINLVLVGVVWWCAHRLTWDCTNVDEDTEVSGEGLLQAAGLEQPEARTEERGKGKEESEQGAGTGGPEGWWQRFQRYREEKRKRRALGVWVVYFSLAALPLFGLGQSLIAVEDTGRRRYAFWLLSTYVACGLGLLLTTCFLSLRRYLRQRRLQMPAAMTGAWLTSGAALIVLLLAVGAVLPRPQAEYPLLDLVRPAKSPERNASRWAFKDGSTGKGEGRAGDQAPEQQNPADATGQGGKGRSDGSGQGKDGTGNNGSGEGKDGQNPNGPGRSSSGQSGQDQRGSGRDGQDQGRGGSRSGGRRTPDQDARQGQGSGAKPPQGDGRQANGQQSGPAGSSSTAAGSRLAALLKGVLPVLKWIVFGVLAVVVAFVVLRGVLQFLANFTGWARGLLDALRNFWASLFGGWGRQKAATAEDGTEAEQTSPERPFASFSNPFADGGAGRKKPGELVVYTFAAFEAWARERDLVRQRGETALELAERVGQEFPALEAEVRRLSALYARAVYAQGGLPANTTEVLRQFWERLEAVAEQPLSA